MSKHFFMEVHCSGCISSAKKVLSSLGLVYVNDGVAFEIMSDNKDIRKELEDRINPASITPVKREKKKTLNQSARIMLAVLVVTGLFWLTQWFFMVPMVVETGVYLSLLGLLLHKELLNSSKQTLIICASVVSLLGVTLFFSFPPMMLVSFCVPFLVGVSSLFLLQDATHFSMSGSKLALCFSLLASVCALFAYVWSPLVWLAVIPIMGYIVLNSNKVVSCDWSLMMVVLVSSLCAILTTVFHLPMVVCLHDTFLAAFLIKLKSLGWRKKGKRAKLEYIAQGEMLGDDFIIYKSSEDLLIDLSKTDLSVVKALILKNDVEVTHEARYKISDLRADTKQTLPKDAVIHQGWVIGVRQKSSLLENQSNKFMNQMDQQISRLVPWGIGLSSSVGLLSLALQYGVTYSIGLSLTTLLACCPCIFLMVYVFERTFENIMGKVNLPVKVNLKNRCLDALRYQWSSKGKWSHVTDRTGVTHGPIRGSTYEADQPYEFYPEAKSWFTQVVKRGESVTGLSASGEFQGPYKDDMKTIGADAYADINYANPAEKAKQFDLIRSQSGKEQSVAYYGDGANDADIFNRDNVLPIAVGCSVGQLNPVAWIKDFTRFNRILPMLIEAQRYVSKIINQGIIYNMVAMLAPILTRVVIGVTLPMWFSCATMLIYMGGLYIAINLKVNKMVESSDLIHNKVRAATSPGFKGFLQRSGLDFSR